MDFISSFGTIYNKMKTVKNYSAYPMIEYEEGLAEIKINIVKLSL
jgi:hypothetical protein